MIKLLIVFIAGLIETFLYTMWCLSANKKELTKSTILMTVYMFIYLVIIAYAIKDADTILLILTYSLACGAGNYLEILHENYKISIEYWWWERLPSYQKKFNFFIIKNQRIEFKIGKLHLWIIKK